MILRKNKKLKRVLAITGPKGLKHLQSDLLTEDNIKLDTASLTDLNLILDDWRIALSYKDILVNDYDFVWIQSIGNTKDVAYLLALYLDKHKVPHTDTEYEVSKLVDLFILASKHLPIPKTFFCANNQLITNMDFIEHEIVYPFLIKATIGWGGQDMYFIRNKSDFKKTISLLTHYQKFLCQSFIPNHFDYRLIVGNGEILSAEKRFRQTDSFRNNASLGAKEVFLKIEDIPKDIRELAIEAAKLTNLRWSGVDIVTDEVTGRSYIMEVNRCPGLTENTSEIDAARKFLNTLRI